MRSFVTVMLTIAFFSTIGSAVAQEADKSALIPAQNAPAGVVQPPSNIKTTGGPAIMSNSYLIKDAPLKSDFVMGNRKAPVVMVEYASLSCPHCAHFSNVVLPELEKKYIETGKMAYVLRQFPLNEPALRGAMLLECVGASSEEKYFTFAKVLFDAQQRWAFDNNFMQGLETIATVGGVSREQFKNCVNDKDREMKVLQDKKTANDELKLPHTPLIYINGEMYEGDKKIEEISKTIDAKLAAAKK